MAMALDELLRVRQAEIVKAFVIEARATVPAQTDQPTASIVDHVPELLDLLADSLETGRTSLPPEKATARQHAKTRWQQGMDVRTLVREYARLRACVIEICGYPTAAEHATFDRFFDTSIAEAVTEFAEIAERRTEANRLSLSLLAELGSVLGEASADQRQALQGVAKLCVPRLADCCSIYLLDTLERRAPSHLTIEHVVPASAARVRDLYERFPLDDTAEHGLPEVVRSGRSERMVDVDDAFYVRVARSPEHLAALRAVHAHSWMVVPLSVGGREPFAVMSLLRTESTRNFTADDLAFTEELARRAALALDHAQLFELARRERARAEEATRAKDEFLAVISHELRTPLNAILGWSRMLRDGNRAPERVARAIEIIERNAQAQARLIGDLLDVSRIVTGNVRLEVGSVDICNVVEMALEAIAPAAQAKGIEVESDLDPSAGIVRGDAARLQQIVWNLVANAVKFTPKQGRMSVRLKRVSSDIELTVEDNGAGIEPSVIPFIFDRFRQEDASVVRAFGGLGLGLSIARNLVELHGGSIRAASPGKGQGSTFTVRMPISPLATTAVTQPVMPEAREHASRPVDAAKVAGMRVLVVEDDADARELLAEMLGGCGVQVRVAESVAKGMEEFQRERPDVILSDVGMPGEDGYVLARKIRALPDAAGGNTPMIALTAYAGDDNRARAIVGGFNAHVAKPVEPSVLLDVLGSLRFPRRG